MMKKVILISAAAYAGATSLRGDGVEEVGDQIEHFPSEDFYVHVDRRFLTDVDADAEAREMMEDYFDEWPDQDVVGHLVEDEDQIYVDAYKRADGEEDRYEDLLPVGGIVVDEVEDEGASRGADDTAIKEYAPDPDSVTFEGTHLTGDFDQYDRREQACPTGKSTFLVVFSTDNYAYETSWQLLNTNTNAEVDRGPPVNTNYADETSYMGRYCLSPGNYKFKLKDSGNDGICRTPTDTFGCGSVRMLLNGSPIHDLKKGSANWNKWWSAKNFPFVVGITSRIDGNPGGGGNQQQGWCDQVRSQHEVPRGTCILGDGTRGHRVRMQLQVDKYGKETSWKIMENNAVRMKLGAVIEKDQGQSVEECLPAGKYKLRVVDLDGVCCRHGQGFFKLIVNGKLLLDGGNFNNYIEHEFQLGFDWLSTMNERDCEWYWAHDSRRKLWHVRCNDKYCNKPYRRLRWSPALKADAKDYAERLLDTCETTGIKHDKTDQGENLAKNKGSGLWGAVYSADKVTKRFVDNEEFWGWNKNAHLTQAMWYPSRYIGCAESQKSMGGGKMCRMQVCRFAKAGNCMMGTYNSDQGNNWMIPMMMDDSPCGPMCASRDGCFH